MDRKKVQKWALAAVIAVGAIIVLQIGIKMLRSTAKTAAVVVKVASMSVTAVEINETAVFQGIANGDPQVKVYPQVPGKFEKAAVTEGNAVKKDAVIVYINRDIVGMDFQLAPVKSPISGIVTKIYFSDRGAMVSPMYPVAEVANPDDIKIEISAGEADMARVKTGMPVVIRPVYGDAASITGTVYSTTPYIDPDTMSGTIIIKAQNPGRLIKPGTSVEARVNTGKRKVIMLPENAVLMGDGKTYVFINENNRAKRIDFTPGYMDETGMEAKEGVTEGMQVITEGNFKLNDGSAISVETDDLQSQNSKVKSQK
jgi:multidrug efflux pump subunit AcrA (membrane-fusion protein)